MTFKNVHYKFEAKFNMYYIAYFDVAGHCYIQKCGEVLKVRTMHIAKHSSVNRYIPVKGGKPWS